jgi:4'-phosphopantetheinyl transferase EntD
MRQRVRSEVGTGASDVAAHRSKARTKGASGMLTRRLFPACVQVAEMNPCEADPSRLHPAEQRQIERAAPGRRGEYSAGRLLARSLLDSLGVAAAPLLNRPDRAPAWPAGFVGSISHCPTLCAVVVASRGDICAIGVDVEPAVALDADVEPLVLTARDRDSIAQLPLRIRAIGARLVFSAKEAFYKALYPATGVFLDFTQAWVTFATEQSFVVTTTAPLQRSPALSRSMVGRYCIDGSHLMTGIFTRAHRSSAPHA